MQFLKRVFPLLLTSILIFGCATDTETGGKKGKSTPKVEKSLEKSTASDSKKDGRHYQTGMASYYADKFHGRTTANGERFNNNAMTAAHRKLPFGTKVRVTNIKNGKSVVVRINDRGPYAHARVIDLSKAAARKIGMIDSGVAKVKVAVLK